MGTAVPTNSSKRTTWCSNRKPMRLSKGGDLLYGGRNSGNPTKIVGIENLLPIGCSDKFVGTIVPTKIMEIPNGGFLLAAPTKKLFSDSGWRVYGMLMLSKIYWGKF